MACIELSSHGQHDGTINGSRPSLERCSAAFLKVVEVQAANKLSAALTRSAEAQLMTIAAAVSWQRCTIRVHWCQQLCHDLEGL